MSSNTKAILFFALAVLAVILLAEMASAQYGGGRGYYGGGRGYGGRGYGGYGYGGGRGYGGYGGRGYGGYGGRGYGGYGGRGYGGYGRGSRTTSYGSSYGGANNNNNDQNYPSDSFTSNDLSQSDNDHDSGSYGSGDGYYSSYDVFTASSSAAQPSTATVSVAQPGSVQPDRQSDWQLEQENGRGDPETPRLLWNAQDARNQRAPMNVFDGPYDMITGDRLPEGQLDSRQAMLDRSGNFEGRQGNQRTSGAGGINNNNNNMNMNKKPQDSLIGSLNASPSVPTSTTTAAPEYVMINPTRNSNRNIRPAATS